MIVQKIVEVIRGKELTPPIKPIGNTVDERTPAAIYYNKDGSLASTGKTVHAVNPDYFFMNRYKVKGKKMILVSGHTSDGYRCIKEQSSGRVFLKNIPAFVIARDADGKLYLDKQTVISDTEFISEFTAKLDNKSMAEILPLITVVGGDMSADSMPI